MLTEEYLIDLCRAAFDMGLVNLGAKQLFDYLEMLDIFLQDDDSEHNSTLVEFYEIFKAEIERREL